MESEACEMYMPHVWITPPPPPDAEDPTCRQGRILRFGACVICPKVAPV